MNNIYSLNTSVKSIKGIGPKKYERFKLMGISTLGQALEHYPHRYVDKSNVVSLREASFDLPSTVKMTVLSFTSYRKSSKIIQRFQVFDEEGTNCTLIYFNSKFLESKLTVGSSFYFYGRVENNLGKLSMLYPEAIEVERFENSPTVEAVYPLTAGISSKDISHIVKTALEGCEIKESLPESVILKNNLCIKSQALKGIHFPGDLSEVKTAERRIIFEEFFVLLLGLAIVKGGLGDRRGITLEKKNIEKAQGILEDFIKSLPFELTCGQRLAIDQSIKDIREGTRMNRLIQGDVGSGKTVVSVACAFFCVALSGQILILAPTEILAKQHFKTFGEMSAFVEKGLERKINISLLTSSISRKDRQELKNGLISGDIDVLVGTHAVLEDDIEFKRLMLVVTDEQHRFGVNQRTVAGTKKSIDEDKAPHIMAMSATPIPRTLSLMLYGDMDISTIYDMPEGRKEVKTRVVGGAKIASMHEFIKAELSRGMRAYFVCPMIDESEVLSLTDATGLYEKLLPIYNGFKIALIHGKMSSMEKNQIMEDFKNGDIQAIISTTVIEVGVNVPEATVMVIYDADRFGLAQLHQLRGRVGRGDEQSWCFLLTRTKSEASIERLKVLCNESSGFNIAQKDLELRGSGEFLGTMQHGNAGFKMADIVRDEQLLSLAQKSVSEFIEGKDINGDEELYRISKKIFENFSI